MTDWWDNLVENWMPSDHNRPNEARHQYYGSKYEVAGRLRPKRIVEIGVRAGYGAFAMLSAVPDAQYMGIDMDAGTHGGIEGGLAHAEMILSRFQKGNPLIDLSPVCSPDEVLEARKRVRRVHTETSIKEFIVRLAGETRRNSQIKLGLSPRACQHLLLAAQTHAFIENRDFIIPEDVLNVAHAVLPHRLILSAEARMENLNAYQIIDSITSKIPVPTGLK